MNKIDSIKIGNFIKTLRCSLKLSQDDLAKKLCEQYLQTSAKAVSDWEKGKTLPDLDKISTLCKILGVTVDELMDGEKKKEIDFLKKYSILNQSYINSLPLDRNFNLFNIYQEQYILAIDTFESLLEKYIQRELTSNEKKEFDFLFNNFFQLTDYSRNLDGVMNIQDECSKLHYSIKYTLLQFKECKMQEQIWELKKLFMPKEDADFKLYFIHDFVLNSSSIIEKRFKKLDFWQKDMILTAIQVCDPTYDEAQSGSNNLKRHERLTGKPYDRESENRKVIKFLIDNGACINKNYLNFYLIKKENKRLIDRIEELYLECKRPLDVYIKDGEETKHYKVENIPKNRFLHDGQLAISLNYYFNERTPLEWYEIIKKNEEIPNDLLLEFAKKNKIDTNREWIYVEADIRFGLNVIRKQWNEYKEKEKEIEIHTKEFEDLFPRLESGEKYYQSEKKVYCGGKDFSDQRNYFYEWNQYCTFEEIKKARDKKATKELYERLDTLTLDDIRKEYLHPLEEEENDK